MKHFRLGLSLGLKEGEVGLELENQICNVDAKEQQGCAARNDEKTALAFLIDINNSDVVGY